MATSKMKSNAAHPIQWTVKSPRYLSDDIVERYTSTERDIERKTIVQKVYERLSADADAELETLSSLGSDMEKVYAETTLSIDRFIGQLILGVTRK
jgi:hypothetical protein